jgi:hypothetical protein
MRDPAALDPVDEVFRCNSVVEGMMTAPSLIAPSTTMHSAMRRLS